MLQLTAQQKLLLAVEPADFRKGIDSLAALCKQNLYEDPYSGTVFAFTNRRKTAVKILMFDSNGFWLAMKRFSKGKLAWWPTDKGETLEVRAEALQILLGQGDPRFMFTPTPWRQIGTKPLNQATASI
jgi:transposase